MNLSLCLEMVFPEIPFEDRLAEAARLGWRAVEFWDWRDKDIDRVASEAHRLGLSIAAISGNRRHSLIDPGARAGLIPEMRQVFDAAARLGCRNIMMLSDVLERDGSAAPSPDLPEEDKRRSIVDGLRVLAALGTDMTLLLEPLNTVLDHRGCFLATSDAAVSVVAEVDHPRVRVLYDIYHMSMMGEDAALEIARKSAWIGYYHAADMPGRHEPGSGVIRWDAIQPALANYGGFIGLEFSAKPGADVRPASCWPGFTSAAGS